MSNIEQSIQLPEKVVKAVEEHQLMAEGYRTRIDPINEITKNCSPAISLRALVREALAHRGAARAIEEEWKLKEQSNF